MHFPTVRDCLEATPTCPGLNSPTLTVDAKPQRLRRDMVTLLFLLPGRDQISDVAQTEMSPNPSHLVSFQTPLYIVYQTQVFSNNLAMPCLQGLGPCMDRQRLSISTSGISDVNLCPINPAAMEKATATTFRFERLDYDSEFEKDASSVYNGANETFQEPHRA